MEYIFAFIACGTFCALGQIIYDQTKLSVGHITSIFVVLGVILSVFGLYDKIIDFGGMGARLPITSFGHSLMTGALKGMEENGFLGIAQQLLSTTSSGIVYAIFFAFLVSCIFKART